MRQEKPRKQHKPTNGLVQRRGYYTNCKHVASDGLWSCFV